MRDRQAVKQREVASPLAPLEAALNAYRAGDFDRAEVLLEFERPSTALDRGRVSLVRAQIARLRREVEAWRQNAALALRELPRDERPVALALAAAAARAAGDDATADDLFAQVRAALRPADDYAAYLTGFDAWERRDYDAAEAIIAPYATSSEPDPLAVQLSAWIAIKRDQFRRAGTLFVAAYDADHEDHVLSRAHALYGMSLVAAETADLKLGRRVRRLAEAMSWASGTVDLRFMTTLNLRVLALLDGDVDRAWLDAREATGYARTPAEHASAEIAAAATSRLLGDEASSRLQFRLAWDRVSERQWGAAVEDERVALLVFAAEAAREMPAEARKALTRYQSLRAKRAKHLWLDDDVRMDALATTAAARVDEASGERSRAIERYRQALTTYEASGFRYRIGLLSTDLFRLTRDDRDRDRAEAALGASSRAAFLTAPSPVDDLGPKARDILARLLLGQSAKMMADELGRSTFTVSNHTRRIFEVFEVHSRDELRRVCAERGITSATLRR